MDTNFENSFENVPIVRIYSEKDVKDRIGIIRNAILSIDENWEDRNKGLQELRSLLLQGHFQTLDDLSQTLRLLEQGLNQTLKDLRSQVCREACLTVAYMAVKLGARFESLAERLLPTIIQLIQNSFRILTLSSVNCAKYILKYVQSHRLVTIVASYSTNKSSIIRKHCCEFIHTILMEWDKVVLERVMVVVGDFIKKGVCDPDAEARMFSRKSFAVYAEMFPEQGYAILGSLEPSKQKQLLSELDQSNPLKTSNFSTPSKRNAPTRSMPPDVVPKTPKTLPRPQVKRTPTLPRNKDVDKLKTLQTPKYKAVQSQPSSRSASPGMAMLNTPNVAVVRSNIVKRSRATQSQCNSRDTSPIRRRMFDTPASASSRKRNMRRMESDGVDSRWRGRGDEVDGMSETSSICSDNSYKSNCVAINERLREVLSTLTSSQWNDRMEGVYNLQEMINMEGAISPHELKSVLKAMTKLLHDPHPRVFNLSLDCLRDLCVAHHDHITDWLPVIFKRLLSKAGSEVLSYQQSKITSALDAIRTSFSEEVQFNTLCSFIVTQPQNVNPKLKSTILTYLSGVCEGVQTVANSTDTRLALSKIVCWSNEPKNVQVRKMAQSVICTLNNNTQPSFNKLVATLPRTLQDSVRKMIAPDTAATPVRSASIPRKTPFGLNNNVNNNYNNTPNNYYNNKNTPKKYNNNYNNNYVNKANRGATNDNISEVILKAAEELQLLSVADDDDHNNKNLSEWSSYDLSILLEEIRSAEDLEEWSRQMDLLSDVAKACVVAETWEVHFKMVLLLVVEALQSEEAIKKASALKVLRSLLHSHSFHFVSYVELTVMNLLEFEKENDRELLKLYEGCTSELSRVIPHEHLVPILPPVALTASHPLNMAAIKLLTKVVSVTNTDDVKEFLKDILPCLIKGFENSETSMRKSSMVCLLELHKHLANELMLHLDQLSPSKIKLLSLYIKRDTNNEESNLPS